MKPSVGRVVHYTGPWSGCSAAIVTGTHMSEIVIDLCVLNRNSMEFREGVAFGSKGMGDTWHWPERVEEDDGQ